MNTKSRAFAAAMLGLSALAMAPGLTGAAHAADASATAAFASQGPTDMLAASAFGVSVGAGRGVRVGVVFGTPKKVATRKVLVRRYR